MRKAVLLAMVLAVAGCGEKKTKTTVATPKPTKSVIKDTVDTVLIRKGQIEAGQRAKKTLRGIDAARRRAMQDLDP